MANLMTLPAEIRMKIWWYAIPEEIELLSTDYFTHTCSLPQNPAFCIRLLCSKARDEVLVIPRPVLILNVRIGDLSEFRQYMESEEDGIKYELKRVKFEGSVAMRFKEKPSQELSENKGELHVHVSQYFETVKYRFLRWTKIARSDSHLLCDYKLEFDVSGYKK